MKILMMLILLLVVCMPIVYAAETCNVVGSDLICGTTKDLSTWEKIKSYSSANPTSFWIIALIIGVLLTLLVNYVFEHRNSDRIMDVILKFLLIFLIIAILIILVIT